MASWVKMELARWRMPGLMRVRDRDPGGVQVAALNDIPWYKRVVTTAYGRSKKRPHDYLLALFGMLTAEGAAGSSRRRAAARAGASGMLSGSDRMVMYSVPV